MVNGLDIMKIQRKWAMPSKDTFSIKPIGELITRWMPKNIQAVADPFCNGKRFCEKCITNDLDNTLEADYHMDAKDFLKSLSNESIDVMLFDPPYSPRQVSECYKKLNKSVNMQTTQSSYWGILKKEIARVVKPNGICITCGWNSGGIGRNLGFRIEEILIIAHGGWHNDTICTVDKKVQPELNM
jgi:hypothetical protein